MATVARSSLMYIPTLLQLLLSAIVCSCTDASTTSSSVSDRPLTLFSASASSHQVSVPRYRLSTYGRRAFSVAGPTVWNSVPEDMRDPECSVDSYRQSLKTFLFLQY